MNATWRVLTFIFVSSSGVEHFFCDFWPIAYILWRNVHSSVLFIFKSVCMWFCGDCWVVEDFLYILDINLLFSMWFAKYFLTFHRSPFNLLCFLMKKTFSFSQIPNCLVFTFVLSIIFIKSLPNQCHKVSPYSFLSIL